MTDKKVGGVPVVFTKGGTASGNYDRLIAKKAADAESRRAHQDRQEAAARQHAGVDGSIARLGSRKFVSSDSPKLVLRYLNKDKSIRQECIAEITHIGGETQGSLDTLFSLVCPKCLERGLPQGESQLMVRNSHRKFFIDTAKAGPVVVEMPLSKEVVLVCGTVTVQDIVRCSNYNCTWTVRIDDSNVVEV